MDSWPRSREVEKPKLTKAQQRLELYDRAESFAAQLEILAESWSQFFAGGQGLQRLLRTAAFTIRELIAEGK